MSDAQSLRDYQRNKTFNDALEIIVREFDDPNTRGCEYILLRHAFMGLVSYRILRKEYVPEKFI